MSAQVWYSKPTGCGGQALVIDEKDGRNVAVVYEEKDAPLLAAAPALLEALKAALEWWHADNSNFEKSEPKWLWEVRAAIAKAEGREI